MQTENNKRARSLREKSKNTDDEGKRAFQSDQGTDTVTGGSQVFK